MTSRSLRARHLIKEIDERCGGRELDLLSVSMTRGVIPRTEVTDKEARADDLSNYKVCRQGDIVVNRMSAYQGALGMSHQAGIVSPDYIVFRPFPGVEPRWLHHVMRSTWFVSEMSARIRGIGSIGTGNVRTPRVSSEEIRDIRVSVPEAQEQRAIADFLDSETACIDAVVDKKKQLIEMLGERRHATIVDAVTVSEPVGPTEVGRMQLRRIFRVVNGGTPSSDPDNWNGEVAWATPVDLAPVNGGQIGATERNLTLVGLERGSRLVPPGSLIVSTRAPIGYVVESTIPMAFNQGCRGLVAHEAVDVRYFRYQLVSCADKLGALGQGSTFVELSGEALAGFVITVPSLEKQRIIADFLDVEIARIDALIERLSSQIYLLSERRQALITAAVTGQIEIPGVAA